jgi:hypothetical protein
MRLSTIATKKEVNAMKWYDNGIVFEGTPEEFRALHSKDVGNAPESPVTVFPDSTPEPESKRAKTPGNRHGHPHVHVNAVLSGGREMKFRSVAAAFRWYTGACPGRKYQKYFQFWEALKAKPICFADASLTIAGR